LRRLLDGIHNRTPVYEDMPLAHRVGFRRKILGALPMDFDSDAAS
jgi:hypothetical protein